MKFNSQKIQEINYSHVRRVDKIYRMHAGLSSELMSYENDAVFLQIKNTNRHILSTFNSAAAFANRCYE